MLDVLDELRNRTVDWNSIVGHPFHFAAQLGVTRCELRLNDSQTRTLPPCGSTAHNSNLTSSRRLGICQSIGASDFAGAVQSGCLFDASELQVEANALAIELLPRGG